MGLFWVCSYWQPRCWLLHRASRFIGLVSAFGIQRQPSAAVFTSGSNCQREGRGFNPRLPLCHFEGLRDDLVALRCSCTVSRTVSGCALISQRRGPSAKSTTRSPFGSSKPHVGSPGNRPRYSHLLSAILTPFRRSSNTVGAPLPVAIAANNESARTLSPPARLCATAPEGGSEHHRSGRFADSHLRSSCKRP